MTKFTKLKKKNLTNLVIIKVMWLLTKGQKRFSQKRNLVIPQRLKTIKNTTNKDYNKKVVVTHETE